MTKQEIISELEGILNYRSPIVKLTDADNDIYIKKEEAIPFSFGGNKCRIAASYFKEIIENDHDCVVTYGASCSNFCRVIANMTSRYGLKCIIVSPEEQYVETPNSEMIRLLGASIVRCPLCNVSKTIDDTMDTLRVAYEPYFIYGGGHGVKGTDSYRIVMDQIADYEDENDIKFDYVFIPLATGTSMSGLIVENAAKGYGKTLIGVSVAREVAHAEEIMKDALTAYDSKIAGLIDSNSYRILGDYTCGGYGKFTLEVLDMIKVQFKFNGINFDTTYTGKGFYGMMDFLRKNGIRGKRILFIHTGGTPLFFRDNCTIFNQ